MIALYARFCRIYAINARKAELFAQILTDRKFFKNKLDLFLIILYNNEKFLARVLLLIKGRKIVKRFIREDRGRGQRLRYNNIGSNNVAGGFSRHADYKAVKAA